MDNPFSKYFTDDMTVKQVGLRYYQLIETVRKGSKEAEALEEAYAVARSEAWERECVFMDEIENNAPPGTTVIVCM